MYYDKSKKLKCFFIYNLNIFELCNLYKGIDTIWIHIKYFITVLCI